MRIGFDARCLEEENISGVGEYTFELLKNLLGIESENQYIIFSNSFRQKHSSRFSYFGKFSNAEIKRFSYPNKFLNFFLWYFHFPKINKILGEIDIFFAPNINFISLSPDCPLVITFHDLSFEYFPKYYHWPTRLWHQYFVRPRKLAKSATKIIAVSQSTQKDLQHSYGVDSQKIKKIYHGISSDFQVIPKNNPILEKIRKKYNLPEKFIFYLGNIEPRKNISAIVSAYQHSVKKNKIIREYKLVLAGNINPLLKKMLEEKEVFWCGYVDRKDRPILYNLASLFVYPSFFEGFGFPVLEAMACGTPVITSNNSSLSEISGKAAILVDPNRPQQLLQAIEILIEDEKLYSKQIKNGLKQVQKFTWKKCADETLSVFQQYANRN